MHAVANAAAGLIREVLLRPREAGGCELGVCFARSSYLYMDKPCWIIPITEVAPNSVKRYGKESFSELWKKLDA